MKEKSTRSFSLVIYVSALNFNGDFFLLHVLCIARLQLHSWKTSTCGSYRWHNNGVDRTIYGNCCFCELQRSNIRTNWLCNGSLHIVDCRGCDATSGKSLYNAIGWQTWSQIFIGRFADWLSDGKFYVSIVRVFAIERFRFVSVFLDSSCKYFICYVYRISWNIISVYSVRRRKSTNKGTHYTSFFILSYEILINDKLIVENHSFFRKKGSRCWFGDLQHRCDHFEFHLFEIIPNFRRSAWTAWSFDHFRDHLFNRSGIRVVCDGGNQRKINGCAEKVMNIFVVYLLGTRSTAIKYISRIV